MIENVAQMWWNIEKGYVRGCRDELISLLQDLHP